MNKSRLEAEEKKRRKKKIVIIWTLNLTMIGGVCVCVCAGFINIVTIVTIMRNQQEKSGVE